jgi:1,4-dihydroxy-2-naphthoyl-CoA hydrolase
MIDDSPDGRSLLDAMPFARLVGIELTSADPERVTATLPWSPYRCTVGGLLAFLTVPEGAATTTISSSTQFTRGLRNGEATAASRVLHRGRTTIVVETDVVDDEGRLAARVTQTQAIMTR